MSDCKSILDPQTKWSWWKLSRGSNFLPQLPVYNGQPKSTSQFQSHWFSPVSQNNNSRAWPISIWNLSEEAFLQVLNSDLSPKVHIIHVTDLNTCMNYMIPHQAKTIQPLPSDSLGFPMDLTNESTVSWTASCAMGEACGSQFRRRRWTLKLKALKEWEKMALIATSLIAPKWQFWCGKPWSIIWFGLPNSQTLFILFWEGYCHGIALVGKPSFFLGQILQNKCV